MNGNYYENKYKCPGRNCAYETSKGVQGEGIGLQDKDKEEKRECYYVVCANFYVLSNAFCNGNT